MAPMDEWLAQVQVRPTVTVGIVLDRPLGTRWFGLSYARGESRALAALCSQESKLPGQVAEGMGALLALPLPEVGPTLLDAPAGQVLDVILPDLAKTFPGIASTIRTARVYRWPYGWTLFRPGYLQHLARLRAERPDAAHARVAFAGDYLVAPNVEGAVTSGLEAAERLLAA
jgi:oxygen-dependent protoporphyrinogen oxidase